MTGGHTDSNTLSNREGIKRHSFRWKSYAETGRRGKRGGVSQKHYTLLEQTTMIQSSAKYKCKCALRGLSSLARRVRREFFCSCSGSDGAFLTDNGAEWDFINQQHSLTRLFIVPNCFSCCMPLIKVIKASSRQTRLLYRVRFKFKLQNKFKSCLYSMCTDSFLNITIKIIFCIENSCLRVNIEFGLIIV